jgi:hypothetical protein
MSKGFFSVVAVLAILAVGAWYVSNYVSQKPFTDAEDVAVRDFVTAFGATLQTVPLFNEERQSLMESNYASFVSPELIAKWASEDVQDALGRREELLWPASIEVQTVRKTAPGSFTVEGTVVEVTSDGNASSTPVIAFTYPVTLTLKEVSTYRYHVVDVKKGALSEIPHRVSIVGYWECVPIKEGYPQTEECLRGIAIDQSNGHLIIELGLMARAPVEYDPGTKVRIEGVMVPAEQLSTDRWQKYDIEGIISATSITEVE